MRALLTQVAGGTMGVDRPVDALDDLHKLQHALAWTRVGLAFGTDEDREQLGPHATDVISRLGAVRRYLDTMPTRATTRDQPAEQRWRGLAASLHPELALTEDYLAVLDGHPTAFPAGERFAYCNGGYVVLALIAERASATPFHDLVRDRVLGPAGMDETAYLRSDELPGRAAVGYLAGDGLRTNVLHLPVRGSGDGGVYSTAADIASLWRAFFAGRIVPAGWVSEMVRPRSGVPEESKRYGLGFWLHESTDVVHLEGYDAGVSFRSTHDPATATTRTVISNTSEGAWEMIELLDNGPA